MGFFGKLFSHVGNAVRKIGHFGGQVLSKVGDFKKTYDTVNNATGGHIGNAIENLPVVGGALKTVGGLLKGGSVGSTAVAAARERYGASKPETLEERGWRRQKMGLENM